MVSHTFLLIGLLLPAVIAGVALLFGHVSRRVGAIGIGVGFLVGHTATAGGVAGFPPPDATAALFYLVLGITLLAWFEGRPSPSALSLLGPRLFASVIVPLLLLKNLIRQWEPTESFHVVSISALVLLVVWTGSDALAERRKGAAVPLCLWLATTGASVALMVSGFAINAQFAGTLASILGAAVVAAWLRPELCLGRGPASVLIVALAALCLGGVHLAELPKYSALLILLAPLAAWLAEVGPLAGITGRKAVLVRFALVAIPVALGLYLAWLERPPPDPYSDY